jgi:hypothetical protein
MAHPCDESSRLFSVESAREDGKSLFATQGWQQVSLYLLENFKAYNTQAAVRDIAF